MTKTRELVDFDRQYAANGRLAGGCDEAGRGPLAGPVACAIAVMPLDNGEIIDGVDDSKKLSEKKREQLYESILKKALYYSIRLIDNTEIDAVNILNAVKKGMTDCYDALLIKPDILLIDYVKLPIEASLSITHGDAISYNIACASILAKVARDRLMREYDMTYPGYGFSKHKGYGTAAHYAAVRELGLCEIHRKTFFNEALREVSSI